MNRSSGFGRVFALVVPLGLAGCIGADAQPKTPERASQVPLILAEALRCAVRQYVPKEEVPASDICVGVRDEGVVTDPSLSVLQGLNNTRVRPRSGCQADKALIAGPVEWLRDDEVQVKGAFTPASAGEIRLAYRVVFENGRWVCVGPVLASDPL